MELLKDVGVPKLLYEGLPFACFITTLITIFTPDVPLYLKFISLILSCYAMVILYVRFDYRFNYKVQNVVPKLDVNKDT